MSLPVLLSAGFWVVIYSIPILLFIGEFFIPAFLALFLFSVIGLFASVVWFFLAPKTWDVISWPLVSIICVILNVIAFRHFTSGVDVMPVPT